jgi:TonB family protein
MKVRSGSVGLGLLSVLVAPSAMHSRTLGQDQGQGQDAPAEAAKRKVKSKVLPITPPLAREMKITGHVKIEATISAEGKVTATKTVGGSPILVDAAIEALKKWRFEPGPKDTTEIIEFDFNGS